MIALGFLLLSCGSMWTIQFDLNDKFDSNQLKGWILESNLYSAKNTMLADDSRSFILNEYVIDLYFKIPDKKKMTTFYDIDIDSLKISMKNYRDTVFVKENSGYFISEESRKWMYKSIYFVSKDIINPSPYKAYTLYIPKEVDSLVLQFDVILKEAEYFSYLPVDSKIPMDSLRIIEGKKPIIVPMKLKLHKYFLKW